MPKSVKLALLAVSVVMVLGIFLGVNAYGVKAASDGVQTGAYNQINVYGEVLQHVQADYVEVPNIPKVTDGALRGLLEALDSESSYLSPADYAAYKGDKGGRAQVGLVVSKRYGYATVVSVVPGSPADKANISDGDILEAIGNQDTRDLSLAMIRLMLEGAPGSELDLAVIRPRKTDPDKVVLNRILITEPPVEQTLYENASILYLKPEALDAQHVASVEQKLKEMDKTGTHKVLLDLRDVATGDVPDALRLANFFVKTGTLATLEGQKYPKQVFAADPAKALDASGPLVVLVNRGTSGPAEIVAGAIQDDKRGELVGEKTFGEGSLQKTFELDHGEGGAVILSIAKYASPTGKQYEDVAVTPGTEVEPSSDNLEDVPTDAKAAKPSVQPDTQLNKALDMLKAKAA